MFSPPPFSVKTPSVVKSRLGKTEQLVIKSFINSHVLEGKITFNVKLKPSQVRHTVFSDPREQFFFEQLKSKRIDALMETTTAIWILEIKDVVRPNAIGQLLVYKDMFMKQSTPIKPVRLGIVAGLDDLDTTIVANKLGIRVFIVNINRHDKRFDFNV